MIPKRGSRKTRLVYKPALIFCVVTALFVAGCGPKEPPLSPEAQVFKKEIGGIVKQMQQSLAIPVAQGDVPAMDAALGGFSQSTAGICIDCPYKSSVLNKDGILLTTFPKNELIGRNFSSYKAVSEPMQKQKIIQRQIFRADGVKIYYISAPLMQENKVVGVVVLALTPNDLRQKWHLTDEEFLALDFNTP